MAKGSSHSLERLGDIATRGDVLIVTDTAANLGAVAEIVKRFAMDLAADEVQSSDSNTRTRAGWPTS